PPDSISAPRLARLSLHDALPISQPDEPGASRRETHDDAQVAGSREPRENRLLQKPAAPRTAPHVSVLGRFDLQSSWSEFRPPAKDRKSTRLNSSHVKISYAVFCL